jgi:hypothetical protein
VQGRRDFLPLENRDGTTRIAAPDGFTRRASVQQRFLVGSRLLLPVGTFEVSRLGQVAEGPTRDVFSVWGSHRDSVTYDIAMARSTTPLRPARLALTNYPVTPEVRAMARQIAAGETDPMRQAAAIEHHLASRFHYVADPAKIGHTMTVDQFLLRDQRGHCEYFAAGMVALMTALDVPARIAGGFYGGTLNPLTGYFVVRREDAHAWVEVWDGRAWQTFDPTPPALRPGNTHDGIVRAYASALGDWINYFWDRHILTFGFGDQIALAVEMIQRGQSAAQAMQRAARASMQEIASRGYAIAMATLLAAAAALLLLARRRQPLFALLARHLQRLGIDVGPAMTMSEAIAELRRTNEEAAAQLAPLIALYEAERFSATADRRRIAQIRRALS